MTGLNRTQRARRVTIAVAATALFSALCVHPTSATATPRSFGDSVVISGRGSGHGDGLSQWGAFGYATKYGWDWTQILSHYYGGTSRDTVDPATIVRINLTALADATATTVIQSAGLLSTNADGGLGRFTAVVARETGPATYRVYGRSDQVMCPADTSPAALDLPTSGWHLLNAAFASASLGARLVASAPSVDPALASAGDNPGVCQPDGSVKHYRGSIEIVNGTDGENRTVNAAPLDQYLRGVVPQESIASWGDSGAGKGANALRAQAVAARTYVLTETRATYAQSCDTPDCQNFNGAARRAWATATVDMIEDPRTDAAVTATSGVVLRNSAGGLAFTQFSASSGGYTSGRNFPPVEDLGDAVSANSAHQWTATVPRTTIEAAFVGIGQLLSIDVVERNGLGEWGGRVKTVRVRGTAGSVTVSGEAFRSALRLKSAWFNVPAGCAEGLRAAPSIPKPSGFHPMTPVRIVDTRQGMGGSALEPGCVLAVHVAGTAGVPANAVAVAVNVTAVGTKSAGFLSAFPCDQGIPDTSSLNARVEAPVANLATVSIDKRGDICVFTQPGTDLLLDLLGWFDAGGTGFSARTPIRIADSRSGFGLPVGPVAAGSTVRLDLVAVAGVVAGSSAVVLNVTATRTQSAGFLTVFPCAAPVPSTSNVNTLAGRDVANEAMVGLGADRSVCVFSNQPTDLVVDLLGVFGAGPTFLVTPPTRLLDSRLGAPLAAGEVRAVNIGADARSVAVNLTSTRSAGAGFVTAFPCGAPVPNTSNLNVAAGRDTANQALLGVGTGDDICITSTVTTDIIVDLQGRFS